MKDDAKECSSTVLRIVRSYHDERGDWLAGLDNCLDSHSLSHYGLHRGSHLYMCNREQKNVFVWQENQTTCTFFVRYFEEPNIVSFIPLTIILPCNNYTSI